MLIVAILELDEDHLTDLFAEFEGKTVDVKVILVPTLILEELKLIETDEGWIVVGGGGGKTELKAVANKLPTIDRYLKVDISW